MLPEFKLFYYVFASFIFIWEAIKNQSLSSNNYYYQTVFI